ncbi:ABC transporter permease [Bacillus sp. T33-2]|uniref:ABC transporter permease n=1 Tax=Bacillus sp. T33-2 TaxID=2054168 RepID=UPI000C7777CB|nr:ABC transporter permease [Bacillus sp. T33-2]PLR89965.1 ABC transporter permease [Bacillus sp. T33-2]
MFDANALWRERFSRFVKDTGRYMRYIFNGHLVIVFLFLIGTAAYYYQEWIKTLGPEFPAALIMAGALGVLLAYSPINTFLIEADKIFLLPLETRLGSYFRRSIIFSLAIQSYLLLMVLAVLMPLYVQVCGGAFRSFFLFLSALIILKALNLVVSWKVLYYIEISVHVTDMIIRFLINSVFLYLLFSGAAIWLTVACALPMVFLLLYYRAQVHEKGLKWELLIDQEEKRMNAFYRVANLFTDVPRLKDRIKRRRWMDWLLHRIPFSQEGTYSHIYARTFLRAGDYSGLFIRLTFIGALALYFLSYGPGQLLFTLLFLYLTGFQLLPLWNHHQNKLWPELYPVTGTARERAFTRLLSLVLYIQSGFFAAALLIKGEWAGAAAAFAVGLAFSFWFANVYSKKRRQV